MNLLQRALARLYGTSEQEQRERTRRTAERIQRRAAERGELHEEERYADATTNAYTRRRT